jgi:glycosyltransferase involved in cell wall biosynthesis
MSTPAEWSARDQRNSPPSTVPVSFLVTSYNKAAYLPLVLDSVWHEAKAVGGEFILVDDGSTDGSDRICENFAERHAVACYWRQENRGVYATINSVAAKARGDWVRFCDSDDPLVPGSTRRLIEVAEEHGAGVAYGGSIPYGPEPLSMDSIAREGAAPGASRLHPDGLMYLIREMNFTPSMAIYRREALNGALPLPLDLVSCQDLATLFPVLFRSKLAAVDEPVCFNLKGAPNQLSANYALTIHQTIRITQHYADLLSPRHKRAALLKAANRTRRWLRKIDRGRHGLGSQLWLLSVVAGAGSGLHDFKTTLGRIAEFYEHDLEPLLARRAKPF